MLKSAYETEQQTNKQTKEQEWKIVKTLWNFQESTVLLI
jgi:nuclear transport factor 2 (NTF2) superfamily protein